MTWRRPQVRSLPGPSEGVLAIDSLITLLGVSFLMGIPTTLLLALVWGRDETSLWWRLLFSAFVIIVMFGAAGSMYLDITGSEAAVWRKGSATPS